MRDLRDQIQSLTRKIDNLQARLESTGCRAVGTLGTEDSPATGTSTRQETLVQCGTKRTLPTGADEAGHSKRTKHSTIEPQKVNGSKALNVPTSL